MNERARFTSRGAGWFALPYMILFILFLIAPIVWGLWMSFTDQSLASTNSGFAGIDNYLEAFTSADMYSSLLNTLFFTLISSVPLVILSFVLAYLVVTGLPGQWLWRLTFFAPYLLPVSVVTAMWGMMFANDFGFINGILVHCGIDQIGWLSEKQVAMWSSRSRPCGGRSASTSCCISRPSRTFPTRCTKPRRWMARTRGAA